MSQPWRPLAWRIPLTLAAIVGATAGVIWFFVSAVSTRQRASVLLMAGATLAVVGLAVRWALYSPAARSKHTSTAARARQARGIAATMVAVSILWTAGLVLVDRLDATRVGFGTLQVAAVTGAVLTVALAIVVYGYVRWATPVGLPLAVDNHDPLVPPGITLIDGEAFGEVGSPIALPWVGGESRGHWVRTTDETVIVAVDPIIVVAAAVDESFDARVFHLSPSCEVGCARAVAVPGDIALSFVNVGPLRAPALWLGKPGYAPAPEPPGAGNILTLIDRDLRGDQLVLPTPRRSWLGGREFHPMRLLGAP